MNGTGRPGSDPGQPIFFGLENCIDWYAACQCPGAAPTKRNNHEVLWQGTTAAAAQHRRIGLLEPILS